MILLSAVMLGLLTWWGAPSAHATGLLLPTDRALPPLAIKSHRVRVQVTDQAAVTRIEQVFVNHTDRQLEATFYFPVPLGATVSDFALWINGRKTPGAVLEKGKARATYESIVRRVRDPGLVEYIDGQLFEARIFPVPPRGTQKVEISYAAVLEQVGSLRRLLYPMKTGRVAARSMEDFTVEVRIDSRDPLAAIYSPTHRVDVHRRSDFEAVVGVEQTAADLEEDFLLYIGTRDEERVGLSLLTHDPDGPGGEDGTFLMVVSPRYARAEDALPARAVTFVIDTSGSMAGDKIKQARQALLTSLKTLRPGDYFNVLSFSTSIRRLFAGPSLATRDNLAVGVAFAEALEAAGGTAIDDALTEALSRRPPPGVPHFVMFVTDGRPTVGEMSPEKILSHLAPLNRHGARVFTMGLGYDLNPVLLDAVARAHGGVSDYARPSEDVGVKIAALNNRIAYPVMTNLSIDYGTPQVHDVYPRRLPDLFQGGQVVVMGRYSRELPNTMTLRGEVGGEAVTIAFDEVDELAASRGDGAHAFISRLWATRKVGHLLEEIRVNGELKELRDEVVRLAMRYGLVTPYTSYLAVDDSELEGGGPAPHVHSRSAAGGARVYEFEDSLVEGHLRRDSRSWARRAEREASLGSSSGFHGRGGKEAVDASIATNTLKEVDSNDEAATNRTRFVDGRLFVYREGVWIEEGTEGKAARKIEYLSDEYFELIEEHPHLKRRMSVGGNIQFEADDEVLMVE